MITAHPDAPEGSVLSLKDYEPSDFAPSSAILCRNTAPLISFAFSLLRRDVGCRVLGREIGQGLIALIKNSMPNPSTSSKAALPPTSNVKSASSNQRASLLPRTPSVTVSNASLSFSTPYLRTTEQSLRSARRSLPSSTTTPREFSPFPPFTNPKVSNGRPSSSSTSTFTCRVNTPKSLGRSSKNTT